VRKLSEMTEQMSQSLLDTVISVTGSMAAPLLRSKQGRAFLDTVPGEVVLASLDAISECSRCQRIRCLLLSDSETGYVQTFNRDCLSVTDKVMDAVEAAERRSLAATSNVVAGAVSRRYEDRHTNLAFKVERKFCYEGSCFKQRHGCFSQVRRERRRGN
jgi:hypothetical protein